MSKQLREAIRAELLSLDEIAESEAPSAREVLGRLWAHQGHRPHNGVSASLCDQGR